MPSSFTLDDATAELDHVASHADSVSVSLESVSKAFIGSNGEPVQALSDISLDVRPGEVLCVLGASGCGKSTLLRLVAGLERPDSGRITTGADVVEGASLERGFVFQDHRLVPWMTVRENVELGLHRLSGDARRHAVDAKLELVGLTRFSAAYPAQLSGGMAQRVAIARALAHQPRVLLLDEPFGALDAITRMQLQDELLRVRASERITTILVTHDIEEALYLGDRILVLSSRPGRVRTILPVSLPRPRDRADPAFGKMRTTLYEQFFQHSR
ncbi:ABC transporter ATP-binding protein [Paraburkholderia sp. BCC1886]|uniref:ABC transporter ATP-binding protein n=1 Tax=Paraburkholderia sp. BCC1886 TaxID=2562670 RepID=UPI0011823F94|nr:ABC transporter ATP-binding protein [Paraburkholderia sp. BCC1886]